MNNLFRGLIAGWGAKKLGGGCFSMIIIFILIWVALGKCDQSSYGERRRQQLEQKPAENQTARVGVINNVGEATVLKAGVGGR